MAREYQVNVTQDDIDKAMRSDSARCVVAQAIARTFPKANRITVDIHSIRFTDGPKRFTYLTPPPVERYVVAFDAGDTIHPFKFRLRTDQRLVATRNRRTDAGQLLDTASSNVRHARRKVEKVETAPDVSEPVRLVAREKLAAAEANFRVVKAEVAAKPKSRIEKHDDVPPDPETGVRPVKPHSRRQTVHGRKTREYGHRKMRINRPDDSPGDFRGPLDTDE